jgi:hypothetical protein
MTPASWRFRIVNPRPPHAARVAGDSDAAQGTAGRPGVEGRPTMAKKSKKDKKKDKKNKKKK